jgi:hypothetical protein
MNSEGMQISGKEELNVKIKDGTVVKMSVLNIEPIVGDRENENQQIANDASEHFKKYFSTLKEKINNEKNQRDEKLTKFMANLTNTSPPNKYFETFVKILQDFQILALLFIPILPLGFYSSWIMRIYTFIFLGGAYGETLFHFSFFVGTFFTFSLLALTFFAFKSENKSLFKCLGFFVKLSTLFYIPSMIGSLSVIFKLTKASWTVLDLYIWFFGVFGILQAILLFLLTLFYTIL